MRSIPKRDYKLAEVIKRIFFSHNGIYGIRRITSSLIDQLNSLIEKLDNLNLILKKAKNDIRFFP